MTIGTLSARSGVPASTIRYWESIGALPHPQRINGRRQYAEDALSLVAVLRLAQSCGFGQAEMRHLMTGFTTGTPPSRRWRDLALRRQQQLTAQICHLEEMNRIVDQILRCRCADMAECGRSQCGVATSKKARSA